MSGLPDGVLSFGQPGWSASQAASSVDWEGPPGAYIDWLLVRRCQVGTSESEHGRTQIWNR
jgi:hypothetical protein